MRIEQTRHGAAASLMIACVLSLSGGCGPAPEGPVEHVVGSIPASRFRFSGQSVDELFRWRFDADANLAAWTVRADLTIERGEQFLRLAGSDRSSLVRDVDFEAGDVDRILVQLQGLQAGQTRLYWARDGEQFSPERQISLRRADAVDGVFQFRVDEHPQWSGRIRHFRLDATNAAGEQVDVAAIVGARATASLPGSTYGRDWGIETDNELRAGFVVTPPHPQLRRVAGGEAVRLYLATALLLPPKVGYARFTVMRADGDGEEPLYSRSIAPNNQTGRSWRADVIDLDAMGDADAELRFAVECPLDDNCAGAFASLETRAGGPSSRPNVVLISIDTLRADRMSLYGNDHRTTPRIDRWAGDSGITFERTIAAAPWTLPSHASMLTGLDPTSHNANYNNVLPEGLELLSERLHAEGYFTAAVTGGGFVDPDFGFRQGFDIYRHWERDVSRYWDDQTASGTELVSGLRHAAALLDETHGRPFFLFFHTYEVHGPFHAQQPYFERFYGSAPEHPGMSIGAQQHPPTEDNDYKLTRTMRRTIPSEGSAPLPPEELPLALAMYDAGVGYTDARIGELIDHLETAGLLDNTIIVLTSDHGEMLGEMGITGHAYLFEPNLLVPLVFSWPARLAGGLRIDAQARTVDIVPTVLELLGHEVPANLDGISLVPQLEGQVTRQEPDALSYAASTNRGVALHFGNGLKYVYDNSLWRPGPVDRLAPVDPDSGVAAMDFSERATELRQQVEQLLEARDGLHMLLVNQGGERDFTVRLQGPAVAREKLKATRLECRCARWLGRSTTELDVLAGGGFGLQFEEAAPGVLSIELHDGSDTYATEVDVSELDEPVAVTYNADGWERTDLGGAEIERGLLIWWQGSAVLGGNEPLDEGLRRQLRALGYLR